MDGVGGPQDSTAAVAARLHFVAPGSEQTGTKIPDFVVCSLSKIKAGEKRTNDGN
jgi:hypothetical protein